jgi:hypothetical protein
MRYYLIDEHGNVRPAATMTEWALWFEAESKKPHGGLRHVDLTDLPGGVRVSTVFLGLDHNLFDDGPPLIFETMIFNGHHADWQARCSTVEQARECHREAVAMALSAN